MAISLTRLSGGNTPADGSDPRTFPAIWNASATAIEGAIAEGGGGSITVSETPPTDPAPGNGDLWWDSANGKLYVYYVDGDSSQWVDAAGPSVAVQSTAPTGYEGQLWLDDTDGSMYVYYTDPGGGASSWIGAVSRSGGILQVVSTTKTDTFSASVAAGAFTSVTGLSVSITPSSTSSKILISGYVVGANRFSGVDTGILAARLKRDSTDLNLPATAGNRILAVSAQRTVGSDTAAAVAVPFNFLDSPNTTSSITYSVDVGNITAAASTLYVNRTATDSDTQYFVRSSSVITLTEVAG